LSIEKVGYPICTCKECGCAIIAGRIANEREEEQIFCGLIFVRDDL